MKFYKNKQNIIKWLDKYKITNYSLVIDEKYGYAVNVNERVNLQNNNLKFIPVKFNYINGDLSCSGNQLTSLEFSPGFVNGGFFCSKNKLISLKFSPEIVKGSYYCDSNSLTTLEFAPKQVGKNFNCSDNKLKSFEFCPDSVLGKFYCFKNVDLKEIQEITDFDDIYLEHKKIITTKLYIALEDELKINKFNKKTIKI